MISKRCCIWILSLLLAMSFLAGSAAAAQNQGEGGPRGQAGPGGRRGPMSPDDRLKQMTKDFNLTSDQQATIKPILVDEQKKMQDLRNDTNADRQTIRSKMQQIQQDTNTQIRAALDDKQKEKFDKQEQEREQRMQNRRGGMGGPGGPPQN
jgi:Spy/CpxP family protein refolding chaperone